MNSYIYFGAGIVFLILFGLIYFLYSENKSLVEQNSQLTVEVLGLKDEISNANKTNKMLYDENLNLQNNITNIRKNIGTKRANIDQTNINNISKNDEVKIFNELFKD